MLPRRRLLASRRRPPTECVGVDDVNAATATQVPGFLRRLLCLIYEGFLLTAVWFVAALAFLAASRAAGLDVARPLFQSYLLLVGAFYFVPQWHRGQTLPMKTWRIRLVSQHGGGVSRARSLLRYICAVLSWSLLGAGLLWALVDRDRQFLHDRLCGTRLIRIAG